MTATCPAGHTTTAEDYCDVCGLPVQVSVPAPVAAAAPPPAPAALGQACPHCGTQNVTEALFCEACGYDFTTGTLPRSAMPPPVGVSEGSQTPGSVPAAPSTAPVSTATVEWVAEVWIDPAWYAEQESPDPIPSAGLPATIPLRSRSVLVGRTSRSRNINPDIECATDTGTSRRQAQLTTDGTRWWVEDLESANGTFVAPAGGPLPVNPVTVGIRHELGPDDRIYVGAWTRIVVRRATQDERSSLA